MGARTELIKTIQEGERRFIFDNTGMFKYMPEHAENPPVGIGESNNERAGHMADAVIAAGYVSAADVEKIKQEALADGWDACRAAAEETCGCHPLKPWDNPYRKITEAEWWAERNAEREEAEKTS